MPLMMNPQHIGAASSVVQDVGRVWSYSIGPLRQNDEYIQRYFQWEAIQRSMR